MLHQLYTDIVYCNDKFTVHGQISCKSDFQIFKNIALLLYIPIQVDSHQTS